MTELNSKEIHCPSYPKIIVQTLEVHFPNFHNFPRSEQLHKSTSHSASEPNMRLILGPFCSSIALHDPSHYSHVMCELTPMSCAIPRCYCIPIFNFSFSCLPSLPIVLGYNSLKWLSGMFCCKRPHLMEVLSWPFFFLTAPNWSAHLKFLYHCQFPWVYQANIVLF